MAKTKEVKLSTELYAKIQKVIDEIDKPIKKYNRNKIKYVCHGCGMKVWGKGGLSIHCNDCDEDLEEDDE